MKIALKLTDSHTGIPYQPVKRTGGHDNFGYVDLKRLPEKLDSIPELTDAPELKEFVRELNHPRSLFGSVGVEKSLSPSGDAVFCFKRTSLVTTVFEILDWNFEGNWGRLYQEMDTAMADAKLLAPELTMIEVEVHWVTFNDHGARKVRGATLWVDGFGRTEEEAIHHWRVGISSLQSYFAQTRVLFERELDKGYKLVS